MGGVCPVLARERYQAIKQLIIKDKKVFIPKLSEQFQVTEETIRRDLDKLELDGVATKVCGGAVLNAERINENIPFFKRAYSNAEEKKIHRCPGGRADRRADDHWHGLQLNGNGTSQADSKSRRPDAVYQFIRGSARVQPV